MREAPLPPGEAGHGTELPARPAHAGVTPELLDRELAETRDALRRAEERLATVHASRSWRLTAPLRLAGSLTRRVRRPATAGPGEQLGPRAAGIALPTSAEPVVSIVIPAHGQAAATERCLAAIAAAGAAVPFEVIVVDDASSDETPALLARTQGLRVVRTAENVGFVEACNRGVEVASGEYVVLLNNDTEVEPGWLDALHGTAAADPTVGIVGAKLLYPDRTVQEAGGIVWADGDGWNYGRGDHDYVAHYRYVRDVDYVSGACLLVRRAILAATGGLDRRYAPAYYEDVDLAFAARALGYRVVYQPRAVVVHHEGLSHGTDPAAGGKRFQVRNRARFAEKWEAELARQEPHDPARLVRARDHRPGPRVLVVDGMVPTYDRDAGSLRMFWLLTLLAELGCVVTFMPDDGIDRRPYTDPLEQRGIEVLYGPLDLLGHLRALGGELELCLLSRPTVAARHLPFLREIAPAAAVLYDTVDLHWVREESRAEVEGSPAVARAAAAFRELELGLARACDGAVAITEEEAARLRAEVPGLETHVVPMIHELAPEGPGFAERSDLLFVGGFRHRPNVDAVAFLAREVMPLLRGRLPGVRLLVAGAEPPADVLALAADDVEILGWVPDLTSLYRRARIAVAPLRYGAGMKGKITESLSHGVPVVTTPVGAEGIGLEHGRSAFVVEGAEETAAAIARLYADPELWMRLRDAGRALVAERYAPDAVRERLAAALSAHGLALPR